MSLAAALNAIIINIIVLILLFLSVSLERFFLIKKARLLFSCPARQLQPLSFWIKSFDIQQGKSDRAAEVYT